MDTSAVRSLRRLGHRLAGAFRGSLVEPSTLSPQRAGRRPRRRIVRISSALLALAMVMLLVGQTTAAPSFPFEAGGIVRQVSSYEQDFNPYGDPWATKQAPNISIPVGHTPACHRLGQKADNTTPNPDETTFVSRSNNTIVWEECGDPMEPPPPGSPPVLQRQGDPVLKNFVAAVKAKNPTIKYVGYIKLPVHSTASLGAPVTPAGLLDFEPIESYFIHIAGTDPTQKANRVKYVDRSSDIYDVTNPQWRQAMAAKLRDSLNYHQMDGLTIDACFDLPEVSGPGPSQAVLDAWRQGCIDAEATLKQVMPDKLVLPMGFNSVKFPNNDAASFQFFADRVDVTDGFYWEQSLSLLTVPGLPASVYNGTVSRFRQLQDYTSARGKILGHLVNTADQNQSAFPSNRSVQLALERYYLAAHLTQFIDARTVMHLWTPTRFGTAFFSDAFFKDWDFNIGSPTGGSTRPAGVDVAVWQREFQRARVVLNASDSPFTVSLRDGSFKTLDGIPVTTFDMPPKSGMVFLLPGSDPIPVTTPTPTPTATPTTPPEQTNCTPRPPVRTSVVNLGGGQLQVTITPGNGGGFVHAIRLLDTRNAAVDFTTQQNVTGAFTYTPPGGSTSVTFTIRRLGTGAFTVPMVVTDGCGDWRTLAGAGTGVR